ncbi:hypothetical protein F5X68DRAFT_234538 [Plectosphaerella plurivora]|uniref:2EXR domain-containing protein n=1 Tax=Plectosphaerella plurivora TaxID=936078 RepID=A0A9P9A687_9PEZI|nr:hypothetical protein F5X68DRAFT_234538 [Plectosphaerella plurivora]
MLYRLFTRLPLELRLEIWETAAAAYRDILTEYVETSDLEFVPDRSTPPPPLMHACRESRTHLIKKKVYVQVFHDAEAAPYHWVNYEADVFAITIPDLMENAPEYESTPVQHVRLEALPGGEYLFNSNWTFTFALRLIHAFATVQTFEIFVDEVLWKWMFAFHRRGYPGGDRCPPNNYLVVNVRTGECIDGENWRQYVKWCRKCDFGPECDPSDSRYESEECPTYFLDEWTFPPKVLRCWTGPDSNATVEPVERYSGP